MGDKELGYVIMTADVTWLSHGCHMTLSDWSVFYVVLVAMGSTLLLLFVIWLCCCCCLRRYLH